MFAVIGTLGVWSILVHPGPNVWRWHMGAHSSINRELHDQHRWHQRVMVRIWWPRYISNDLMLSTKCHRHNHCLMFSGSGWASLVIVSYVPRDTSTDATRPYSEHDLHSQTRGRPRTCYWAHSDQMWTKQNWVWKCKWAGAVVHASHLQKWEDKIVDIILWLATFAITAWVLMSIMIRPKMTCVCWVEAAAEADANWATPQMTP